MSIVNAIDQGPLFAFKNEVEEDSTRADRWPAVVAQWVSDSRSRVEFGDVVTHIGGDGELNSMQMALAAFAACDVDVVAMHATMIGLEIKSLSIEASGHFNVQSYMGLDGKPGSGYDRISYKVRLDAPEATPEQIEYLRERCERSSPVGDTLSTSIPLELEFV